MQEIQTATAARLSTIGGQKMLTDTIQRTYKNGVNTFKSSMKEVSQIPETSETRITTPALSRHRTGMDANQPCRKFGAAGIMVLCDTVEEMLALAENLDQLTTTLPWRQAIQALPKN